MDDSFEERVAKVERLLAQFKEIVATAASHNSHNDTTMRSDLCFVADKDEEIIGFSLGGQYHVYVSNSARAIIEPWETQNHAVSLILTRRRMVELNSGDLFVDGGCPGVVLRSAKLKDGTHMAETLFRIAPTRLMVKMYALGDIVWSAGKTPW